MSMLGVLVRAHRATGVVAVYACVTVAGLLAAGDSLGVPLAERDIPVRLLVAIVLSTVGTVALLEPVPDLGATFVRGGSVRLGVGLTLTAWFALAWVGTSIPGPVLGAEAFMAAMVFTSGALAVHVLNSAAWIVPFALGALLVFVDGSPAAPLSMALGYLPLVLAPMLLLVPPVVTLVRRPTARSTAE
ncbi:hypothetical protein [Serinibacter salmoneus]|uniref:hypothetical protein n=1 Tax=Serinibacter salmoneus TaxID=556530 RepID=UPI00117B839E|nr:hypothetical protein [Serinibacter salmoneus]